jgi:hypothetical protein
MFYVLKNREIVAEVMTKMEAESRYRALLAQGWRYTESAAIYEAESRRQMQDHLDKKVRLICAGVGDGYWEAHRIEATA